MSESADAAREKLASIFSLINSGEVDAAVASCRKYMVQSPNDINVMGVLGALLLKRNELDEAECVLLRTIELEPDFAKPHEDLGLLYLNRNEAGRALECFERALSLDPAQATAHRGLATTLRFLDRKEDAEMAFAGYLNYSPAEVSLSEAARSRQDGDEESAERICAALLQREPENVSALRMLAVIASDGKRYVVAEGMLRKVLQLRPQSSAAIRQLGLFLADRSRFPEAIELLERQEADSGADASITAMLGDMYTIVGRTDDALVAYERALELSPENPAALLGRAHMLRIGGRADDAAYAYQRCIAVRPDIGDAWWSLASLGRYEMSDDDVKQALKFADDENTNPESRVAFRFALARACEKRSEFNAAWSQYELGNALKRTLVSYDPVELDQLHNRMRTTFKSPLGDVNPASAPADAMPVFIVGMPRSGSTLVEQILASHSLVEGAGELPYIIMISAAVGGADDKYPDLLSEFDASQLQGLGMSYLHHARTHCSDDTRIFTDKMPANFSHIGFIQAILPNAKFIDARRDPLATCVANFRHLFAKGKNQTYDQTELAEHYLQYVRIMEFWDDVLPDAVLRVQYEEVVSDLEAQVRRILDFCELDFESACLSFHDNKRPVNTASSEQVRRPIYRSGIDFHKNFEPDLEEFREILQQVL